MEEPFRFQKGISIRCPSSSLKEGLRSVLEGERLRSVPHGNHFWFSWVVFRPDTRVWTD